MLLYLCAASICLQETSPSTIQTAPTMNRTYGKVTQVPIFHLPRFKFQYLGGKLGISSKPM